jgi:arylsulfatase B
MTPPPFGSALRFAGGLALAGLLALAGPGCASAPPPPNIVLILADDLGWNDVGYHGGDIHTPHLDRLAAEGVRLERFYTTPICSPTRAGLLTGRYPIRFGMMRSVITPWSTHGLPPGETTLAEMLRDAGYGRRALVGKWHLGHASREFHPLNQGFTDFYGHLTGSIRYVSHRQLGALDWHRDWAISHDKGYSTDLIAREAVRQIDLGSAGEEPFFLYVAFNAPHRPLAARRDDLARYPDRKGPRRTYAAVVDSLDQAIGRILDALEARGIARRTLVLFASDNGAVAPGDNHPLRSHKASVYEGGIRVPAIIRWPDGFEGAREVDTPMGYIDVYPTLKRIVGLTGPDPEPLDGVDVLDAIRGRGGESAVPERDWYSFFSRDRVEKIAVSSGPFKLVAQGPSVLEPRGRETVRLELFDLRQDPGETHNVASSHPEVVSALFDRLRAFRRLQRPGVEAFEYGRAGFQPPADWSVSE